MKRVWIANGLDCKWALKSRSPSFEIRTNERPFSQKPLEIWTKIFGFQMVLLSNGCDYIAIAKAKPFETQTF